VGVGFGFVWRCLRGAGFKISKEEGNNRLAPSSTEVVAGLGFLVH